MPSAASVVTEVRTCWTTFSSPLTTTTWWAVFDWYTVQTGNQTMGLYKMDHATIKPVANRLRQVYRPFKLTSETATANAVDTPPALPAAFALGQNYPNPFNPRTMIRFELPEPMRVRLSIFDVRGRLVKLRASPRYLCPMLIEMPTSVASAGVTAAPANTSGRSRRFMSILS